MTTSTSHRGSIAPVLHHLRPLMTNSSPARVIVVEMLRASEEATPGSVMQNAERISAANNGCNQRSCCSGVPNMCRISMFPVSGAAQFMASGAIAGERPDNSAITA